ncbi:signal peptidase II [Ligilactobacillus murinus]|uniref:Lipoprotein signal peptidase n=1 Tax=Ligilactobacillus murinus TaxID=1622 RepID=A0AAD0L4Y4_9LACO|nr:signal peptidase II [Ligilactobacillus murinus]HBV47560.1 signal peptidase II [Lactobacillus sp.]AWZ39489.1 signal peptidase II [Ligilactobacillus murinus]AWZ41572.1 signal peptidase II [Ligilactobacillus murinus]MCR1890447.1 signal peptidase II [Ligilactobacillus murinus]HCM79467.1 signal peptidase II [Lactobacillus sp.]
MTLYICLMVAVVLSDQLLKFYIQQNVPLNVSYEVIPDVLSIGYVRNFGAAWSMWLGQRWLLSIISLVALVIFGYYFKKLHHNWGYGLGFSLLIGGTLGNLLDRLFSGYVVDMLELDLINFPVFNIADCALTLGVIVILITMLKDDEGII